jgi:hypothetical protein
MKVHSHFSKLNDAVCCNDEDKIPARLDQAISTGINPEITLILSASTFYNG